MKQKLHNNIPSLLTQAVRTALLAGMVLQGPTAFAASTDSNKNSNSLAAIISGNGQVLTYTHIATSANGYPEVFVHHLSTGKNTRVSVTPDGKKADGGSNLSSISSNGRYVAFDSQATNLVSGDSNSVTDIFVRDLKTRKTERISLASDGVQANADSSLAAISPDGRYVAFSSAASNLVKNDGNGAAADIFVHDRNSHETTRITSSDGTESDGQDEYPAISEGGRFVAFTSDATNLVPGDTNKMPDIFVHDRETGETTRVSVASDGAEGNAPSLIATLSRDGRYIAFTSMASNLVTGDTNGTWDAFIHDRKTHQTTRISVASDGTEGNADSKLPVISANGTIVAFVSEADNLIKNDQNGKADVFIHNLKSHRTTRLTTAFDRTDANGDSNYPSISDNGRFVAIESYASNLIPNDTDDDISDTFVADLQAKP